MRVVEGRAENLAAGQVLEGGGDAAPHRPRVDPAETGVADRAPVAAEELHDDGVAWWHLGQAANRLRGRHDQHEGDQRRQAHYSCHLGRQASSHPQEYDDWCAPGAQATIRLPVPPQGVTKGLPPPQAGQIEYGADKRA